jgi:hypothetical protein
MSEFETDEVVEHARLNDQVVHFIQTAVADHEARHHEAVEREHEVVQPGENALSFAARAGVSPDEVHRLNELLLLNDAQARGFGDHRFLRTVQHEDGTVSQRSDYHVFAGQRLRVRPAAG